MIQDITNMAEKYFPENCIIPKGSHVIIIENMISKHPDYKSFTIQCNLYNTIDIYKSVKEMLQEEIDNVPIIFKEDKKKTHSIIIRPKNKTIQSKRFMISYSQASSADVACMVCMHLCKGECYF